MSQLNVRLLQALAEQAGVPADAWQAITDIRSFRLTTLKAALEEDDLSQFELDQVTQTLKGCCYALTDQSTSEIEHELQSGDKLFKAMCGDRKENKDDKSEISEETSSKHEGGSANWGHSRNRRSAL